jgi:hypothetical protein
MALLSIKRLLKNRLNQQGTQIGVDFSRKIWFFLVTRFGNKCFGKSDVFAVQSFTTKNWLDH